MKITDLQKGKIYRTNKIKHCFSIELFYLLDIKINKNYELFDKRTNQKYDCFEFVMLSEENIITDERYSYWAQEFEEVM